MDLAFITPIKYLNKYAKQGDIHLALAHLIDDNGKNEYARFHRREAEQGKRVILDNGLFEEAQVEPEILIRRARAIKAQVVCAPDSLYDAQGTIKEFKRFIRLKQEEGLVAEVMGIPQASNPVDWWECFRFLDLSSDCDLIGLSILSIPKAFGKVARTGGNITTTRMYFLRQLFVYAYLLDRRTTPCHLLGLGDSYDDIIHAQELHLDKIVLSNDSSSVFVHGMNKMMYGYRGRIPSGKIVKRLDFSIKDIDKDQERYIEHNLKKAKECANWF